MFRTVTILFFLAAVVAAVPLILTRRACAKFRRSPGATRLAAWNRCSQFCVITSLFTWSTWILMLYGCHAAGVLDPLYAIQPLILRWLLLLMLVFVIPFSVTALIALEVYPVHRVYRELPTPVEYWGRWLCGQIWMAPAGMIPLVALLLVRFMLPRPVLFAIVAGFLLPLLTGLALRLLGTASRLDRGELVDRVRELAAAAGVEISSVMITYRDATSILNASITGSGILTLTEGLLTALDREEVDAVIAHELAHLKFKHHSTDPISMLLGLGSWLVATYILAAVIPLGGWRYLLYLNCWVALFLLRRFQSRRHEDQADSGALSLTGHSNAYLRAFFKILCCNESPHEPGRMQELLSTHPGLRRRIRTAARRIGRPELDEDSLYQEIVTRETRTGPGSIRYPIREEDGANRVFTSRRWMFVVAPYYCVLLTASMAVAYAVYSLLICLFPQGGVIFGAAIAAASFATFIGAIQAPGYRLSSLLLRRLRTDILKRVSSLYKINVDSWLHVGFAPGHELRNYGLDACWDVGFLRLERDRLIFLGDGSAFELAPGQVLRAETSRQQPGFYHGRDPRLTVTWRATPGGLENTFTLEPRDARSRRESIRMTLALTARIQAWKAKSLDIAEMDPGVPVEGKYGLPVRPDDVLSAAAHRVNAYSRRVRTFASVISFGACFAAAWLLERVLPGGHHDTPALMLGAMLIGFAGVLWIQPYLNQPLCRRHG